MIVVIERIIDVALTWAFIRKSKISSLVFLHIDLLYSEKGIILIGYKKNKTNC